MPVLILLIFLVLAYLLAGFAATGYILFILLRFYSQSSGVYIRFSSEKQSFATEIMPDRQAD